jgi:hypothetical protein
VAAEQVIKASTILPMDEKITTSLEPLVDIAMKSFDENIKSKRGDYIIAWRAFALSRFEYRRGDYTNAILWGQKSLAYTHNRPTCIAMSHAIIAMAYKKLNQSDQAQAELAQAREIIVAKLPGGVANGLPISGDTSGFWHDWIESLILLNEATFKISGLPLVPLIPANASQPAE